MAALNFPSSPATGDLYTANGKTWQWDGVSWLAASASGVIWSVSNADGTLTISPTTGAVVGSLNLASANIWTATQTLVDVKIGTVGKGIYVKEGSNATMGVATLVAGTAVVSTNKVTASSRIFLEVQSLGTVAVATPIAVTARSAGVSFTISSSSVADTSVVAWWIVEPA